MQNPHAAELAASMRRNLEFSQPIATQQIQDMVYAMGGTVWLGNMPVESVPLYLTLLAIESALR